MGDQEVEKWQVCGEFQRTHSIIDSSSLVSIQFVVFMKSLLNFINEKYHISKMPFCLLNWQSLQLFGYATTQQNELGPKFTHTNPSVSQRKHCRNRQNFQTDNENRIDSPSAFPHLRHFAGDISFYLDAIISESFFHCAAVCG